MIIKSSIRASHTKLAKHLLKNKDIEGQPQAVEVSGSRYLLRSDDIHISLNDMASMAKTSDQCQKDLFHISISPAQSMSEPDWQYAWKTFEAEFGFEDRPYIEVTHDHLAKDRPPHKHRVYERVDPELGKTVGDISFNRKRNELVARKLEHHLEHELTLGKHNRYVMMRLHEQGDQDIVNWMGQAQAHTVQRPIAELDYQEIQQQQRTRIAKKKLKAVLLHAWHQTQTGQQFSKEIAPSGLTLARGDRCNFVIVDPTGGTHSPRKMLRIRAQDLSDRWDDLERSELPSVQQAKAKLKDTLQLYQQQQLWTAQLQRQLNHEHAQPEVDAQPTQKRRAKKPVKPRQGLER